MALSKEGTDTDTHTGNTEHPFAFCCSISNELMVDPVILISDYQTYDKSNLEQWITMHGNISPVTNKTLETAEFIPNLAIKMQIDAYNKERKRKQKQIYECSFCCVSPTVSTSNPVRLLLVGDCNVGKTSIKKFIEFNEADPNLIQPTIGIESSYVQFKDTSKNTDVVVRITDICGHDRFRSITRQCYRNIHGVILIASLDCADSVKSLENRWMESIHEYAPDNVYGIVIMNKCDLLHCCSKDDEVFKKKKNEYEYSMQAAVQFANIVGFPFYCTSTVTGEYVHTAFADIVSRIINDNLMWDRIQHHSVRNGTIRLKDDIYEHRTACADNGCMWALKGVGDFAHEALHQVKSRLSSDVAENNEII